MITRFFQFFFLFKIGKKVSYRVQKQVYFQISIFFLPLFDVFWESRCDDLLLWLFFMVPKYFRQTQRKSQIARNQTKRRDCTILVWRRDVSKGTTFTLESWWLMINKVMIKSWLSQPTLIRVAVGNFNYECKTTVDVSKLFWRFSFLSPLLLYLFFLFSFFILVAVS